MGRIQLGGALIGDEGPGEIVAFVQRLAQMVVRDGVIGSRPAACRSGATASFHRARRQARIPA